jgi:hypothetical protein
MPQIGLWIELLLIFVGLPLGYRYSPWRIPALPLLWAVAGYAWWRLSQAPQSGQRFDLHRFWNPQPLAGSLGGILGIFGIVALLLWLGVRLFTPELLWGFARQHPVLYSAVMVLYPVLSVYPQGLLYRAFFLHRYAVLFPDSAAGHWAMIVASAAAFGFLHIIFRNPLAVSLTFFGGILFAWRYQETGSLFVSSFEHALYGCWLFTIGLGQYFYHGVWPEPK